MSRHARTLQRVLQGTADSNVRFADLRSLLLSLGFEERIKGSHHILFRTGVEEILNLQSLGSLAKACQVKQVPGVILRYRLGSES